MAAATVVLTVKLTVMLTVMLTVTFIRLQDKNLQSTRRRHDYKANRETERAKRD